MSRTVQEQPSIALSPTSKADYPASIHLIAKGVRDEGNFRELPPSIFPCLDATPGRGQCWQSAEISLRDVGILRGYCSRYNVSSPAVLQAAWALVLRCYIGTPSVCFACDVLEGNGGPGEYLMSNLVSGVCVADIEEELSVLELIKTIKMRKYTPRAQLHEASLFPAQQSGAAEIIPANTLILLREDKGQEGLDMGRRDPADWDVNGSIKPKIILEINISRDRCLATINYLPSTLSIVSAPNVANVFVQGIHEILKAPNRVVKDIDLFSPRDLEHLKAWNQPFPQQVNACVHELVLKHAEASPQAPAICSWDGDLTYQELDKMTYPLAREFIKAGVEHETLVPICFRKSLYAVAAMIAIHRAGGAFVPLDPSHPEDRLRAIVDKAKAKIVIASPETAHLFRHISVSVVQVSQSLSETSHSPLDSPLPAVKPDHAAFVLFTSGSTGKPKGILQEHASVCTSSLAHGRAMHVSCNSRVFQYAAFTFDVSMMDIFTTLIYGGCVCIPSEEDRMGNFTAVMNRMRVNWVLFTPSVASLIGPKDVPTLETLVYGGEAVKQENVSRWVGKVHLFNCYGPAECGACSIGEFTRSDSRPANIGRQFGGELCWVVDAENHDRLLPVGAVGELVVEGPTLARGYLDDIAKTQAAFIKSPAWPQGAGPNKTRRIYKTGDLVRQNSNGTFDFVGRKDLQVKVRGQRVEIGEVEHHMSTHPGIALSVAARPQSGPYAQTLVGVIQLVSQVDPSKREIGDLDHLSHQQILASEFDRGKLLTDLASILPAYMVPTHVLLVTRLPLSVSGKIDRKIVDAWLLRTSRPTEPIIPSVSSEYLLPKDNQIAKELCSKVLSLVAEPGSSFFKNLDGIDFLLAAVGLDSIKVINLIMFIRQRFGVKINLEMIMDPKSSIGILGGAVASMIARGLTKNVGTRIDSMETFKAYRSEALKGLATGEPGLPRNVFLTGGTGFLGSRILRQLCRHKEVHRVLVHVRSQNTKKALQRIVETAMLAGWWEDGYAQKIEAWTGDLARPKLGIGPEQWDRVCGHGPSKDRVTSIIHNGASVNWNVSFSALKTTNVDATVDLLKAASESAVLTDFVFVSGGQQLRVEADEDGDIAQEVAQSNGYAQSKFLSELMVKEYARTIARRQQRVQIVKPGYIIGGTEDGIGIVDHFIWRLTAGCADINSYNADDADGWLFVSDVDRVAASIAHCCCAHERMEAACGARTVKILDGLPVSDFWSLVEHELGCEIGPLSADSWTKRLYANIETRGEKHPLWPLLQTVEEGQGRLGARCRPPVELFDDHQRIKAAIRRNIEYLKSIGFLTRSGSGTKIPKDKLNMHFVKAAHMDTA